MMLCIIIICLGVGASWQGTSEHVRHPITSQFPQTPVSGLGNGKSGLVDPQVRADTQENRHENALLGEIKAHFAGHWNCPSQYSL